MLLGGVGNDYATSGLRLGVDSLLRYLRPGNARADRLRHGPTFAGQWACLHAPEPDDYDVICRKHLTEQRTRYVEQLLERERAELSELERQVVERLAREETEGMTMAGEIRDCLPPDRNPRKPKVVLPRASIDTHVHIFEPGYKLSPGRGYNPPYSTLADLKLLHSTLGIERVVFTQPSVYGVDNSAILNGMAALNAETANRARAVVAITMGISDDELVTLDRSGVRGVRLNTDNKGGMPIEMSAIPDLAARIAPFGWHIEFLFPGKDIIELMPTFAAVKVPISIGHFAYQPATAGVLGPGFQALIELTRRGNTWIKISGANRVSETDLPPYDDVKPMAHALIEAAPERIMWGTDWPHPNKYLVNPNDGDLVDAFGDWVTDEGMRRKIMLDNPAAFYRF